MTVDVHAQGDETILDALHRSGLTIDAPCRSGGCGVCRVRVVSGTVRHGPHTRRALPADDERNGFALACRAAPIADGLVIEPLTPIRNRFGHWSAHCAPAASQRKRTQP
ncbi:MAG: 2Fe-2S iron-sulfur cluster binding domain-containing protein [Actinobacteria bacterium]|nr:2Fe-2S iron-sulfur cluster binding domain-containing protein [Actinomycetota bacterium]